MSGDEIEPAGPALLVVKGEATPEEIAALTVALEGMASAAAPPAKPPRSAWGSPQRRMRPALHAGPGAWKASSLPR